MPKCLPTQNILIRFKGYFSVWETVNRLLLDTPGTAFQVIEMTR